MTARYRIPDSVEEALVLLAAEPDLVVVAGGTAVVGQLRRRPRPLLDLRRAGLAGLHLDPPAARVGAMAVVADFVLAAGGSSDPALALLGAAASRVGSSFIRAGATMGGSTVACFRWSDLPAALLAVDARMVVRTATGESEHGAVEFFASHPVRLFRGASLLTEVIVPTAAAGAGWSFRKLSPLRYGYAVWDAAVLLPPSGSGARVAVSGGTSLPVRLPSVEKLLDSGLSSREELEAEVGRALDEVGVVGSRTVSSSYRRTVGPVVVADAVAEARTRMQEGRP